MKLAQLPIVRDIDVLFGRAPAHGSGNRLAQQRFNGRMNLAVRAQYESGVRWSSRRSEVIGFVRDARFDANTATRLEIIRKSRYWERNSELLNKLFDLFELYTVGANGLRMVPDSSDPEWNKAAAIWWNGWQPFCDLTTLQPWGTCQSLIARAWACDGECFIVKTHGRPRPGGQAFPRIQLVETHRVSTPGNQFGNDQIVDGIQTDLQGRAIGYWIRQGPLTSQDFELVSADNVIHVFEPSRINMYRGLPITYSSLNTLHDLQDLEMWEMDAAKDASSTTNIIQTNNGELPEDELRRNRLTIEGDQGTSGGSSQERFEYYKEIFQSRAKVLRDGDKYEQFISNRPSVVLMDYFARLENKVCAGVGISKLLVYPWSMQGTVTRADLDVMATFFRSRSSILSGKFRQVYEFAMGWAKENDETLLNAPPDWYKVKVRPPRAVNVDVGRNASALIAEYAAGWRSLEEICGELGEDWTEVLEQRAKERKVARDLEVEYGLQPGELIEAALTAIGQNAKAATTRAGDSMTQKAE